MSDPLSAEVGRLPILPMPGDALPEISIEKLDNPIFGFASRDIRSRGFNLLRGQIAKMVSASGHRLIGITSATPRVGKSFVAANLAAALSRSPERHVYLVDLDLRRSSVADYYGLTGQQGIADYLAGDIESLVPTAVNVADHGLTLLPSFARPASSADLLVNERMTTLIEALCALPKKVIVLCDMPPAFANDDAVIIARQLDGYLLVVEEGVTTRKQIRDTIDLLDPAPCLGSVLNKHAATILDDSYGYGYASGAYSKYYG